MDNLDFASPAGPPGGFHITSPFGWRTNPHTGLGKKFHRGVDLRTHWPKDDFNMVCRAFRGGKIEKIVYLHDVIVNKTVNPNPLVCIRDDIDDLHYYIHIKPAAGLAVGQRIEAGQTVGVVDLIYGTSISRHLHFSIMRKGVHIDPVPVMIEAGLREV